MKRIFIVLFSLLSIFLFSQELEDKYPCSIGTSLWSFRNFFEDPGDFYQLTLGYDLSSKSTIYLNGKTWKYPRPIGIPYGPSFESDKELYDGYARAFGLGLGYQYKFWKDLFVSFYGTPFYQTYYNDNDALISTGFQLFLQAHLGYEINLFSNRFFIKPAISFNYWPINTGVPKGFQEKDESWPDYFLFEPHLNIGYRF